MADRYAILPAATTSNWSSTGTWSAASGGATGASVPTSADNVFVDVNSVAGANAILSVDAAASCLDMDWTGATNTPTFANTGVASHLNIYGDCTFIAAMTITLSGGSGNTNFAGTTATTLTTNGVNLGPISFRIIKTGAGSITLVDNVTHVGDNTFVSGTFDTNGKSITGGGVYITGAGVRTLTLGASTINNNLWNYSGSNLTVTANTATINISGTGACALGSANWNGASFNLNGTAHAVSGNPTGIATVATPPGTTQTLTITAGNVIRATTMTLSGDATHQHTIQSSVAGTLAQLWATNKTDDYVIYTNILRNYNGVIVSDCAGAGGGTFAGAGGVFGNMTIEGTGVYALTITGNNQFNIIHYDAWDAAKTVKYTDGSTQSVYGMTRDAGTNIIILTGTGVAGWNIVKLGSGAVSLDYMDISYSTAT